MLVNVIQPALQRTERQHDVTESELGEEMLSTVSSQFEPLYTPQPQDPAVAFTLLL